MSIGAIAQLEFKQITYGKKFVFLIILVAIPVGLSVLLDFEEWESAVVFLYLLFPQLIALLATLLYGTGILQTEVENKTLIYLFSRAVPRWQVLLGKYALVVSLMSLVLMVGTIASWLILGALGTYKVLVALCLAILGAVLVYTALFTAIAVLFPRKAIVIGLLYAIFGELLFSFLPTVFNQFTITYYLRSMVLRILDYPLDSAVEARIIGSETPSSVAIRLGAIWLVSLLIAVFFTLRREFRADRVD